MQKIELNQEEREHFFEILKSALTWTPLVSKMTTEDIYVLYNMPGLDRHLSWGDIPELGVSGYALGFIEGWLHAKYE